MQICVCSFMHLHMYIMFESKVHDNSRETDRQRDDNKVQLIIPEIFFKIKNNSHLNITYVCNLSQMKVVKSKIEDDSAERYRERQH